MNCAWMWGAASQKPPIELKDGFFHTAGRFLAVGLLVLFATAPVLAQMSTLVDRLPADTWAYISWGGTASLKSVSTTNSVLRLWNDPSFRAFLENSIGTVSHEGGPTEKLGGLSAEQAAEMFSALENRAVLGFTSSPENSEGAKQGSVSYFLVYDITRKQALVDKWRHQRDVKETERPQVTKLSVAGVSVTKRVFATSTSYEAEANNFFISAASQHTMRELLGRFGGGQVPAATFMQSTDFPPECRDLARPSILNVMVLAARFSLPPNSANSGFDVRAFGRSLHADRIRAACMSTEFDNKVTRTRGAVLGDTSQGSILKIFGDGRDSFETLALASSHSSVYVSTLDFAALYNSLFNAVSAALPGDRAPFVAAGVAFLTSSWGLPPDQFFALFTGEAAVIHSDNGIDPAQGLYAFTIHDSDRILHVLQHALPGAEATTSRDGDVSYVTVAPSTRFIGTSSSASSPIYFALTPDMLLASKQQEVLRRAVVRLHAANGSAPSDALTVDPDFRKACSLLPAKLVSLSYTNYAYYDWQRLFSDTEKRLNDQMQEAARKANKPSPPRIDILRGFNPSLFSSYLHIGVGGAWKDSTGIYFDSYIQ